MTTNSSISENSSSSPTTIISFYHPLATSFHKSLSKLMQVILSQNNKILLIAENEEKAEEINNSLWSSNDKFIPHGTKNDGNKELQPIYITNNLERENPNNANILFSSFYLESELISKFNNFIYFINSSSEDNITKARQDWTLYKNNGFNIKYWQQEQNLSWTNKV